LCVCVGPGGWCVCVGVCVWGGGVVARPPALSKAELDK
jgi:hypothetical protein